MIYIASDHAGFELKHYITMLFSHINIKDLGTDTKESCDYPIFAKKLTNKVLETNNSCGILICGTGIGMSIAANRIKGIRAALCFNENMARLAKNHNDANVLVLGANVIAQEQAGQCVKAFLESSFDGDRHIRRLELIDQ